MALTPRVPIQEETASTNQGRIDGDLRCRLIRFPSSRGPQSGIYGASVKRCFRRTPPPGGPSVGRCSGSSSRATSACLSQNESPGSGFPGPPRIGRRPLYPGSSQGSRIEEDIFQGTVETPTSGRPAHLGKTEGHPAKGFPAARNPCRGRYACSTTPPARPGGGAGENAVLPPRATIRVEENCRSRVPGASEPHRDRQSYPLGHPTPFHPARTPERPRVHTSPPLSQSAGGEFLQGVGLETKGRSTPGHSTSSAGGAKCAQKVPPRRPLRTDGKRRDVTSSFTLAYFTPLSEGVAL